MIYSVFDWNSAPLPTPRPASRGSYAYFEAPEENSSLGIRPKARRSSPSDSRGQKLEEMLPELPAEARLIGHGDTPKGRVAVLNAEQRAALGENPLVDAPWTTLVLWVGGVYVAYNVAVWLGRKAASPAPRGSHSR